MCSLKNTSLTHILSTLFSSTSVLFSCTPFGTKSYIYITQIYTRVQTHTHTQTLSLSPPLSHTHTHTYPYMHRQHLVLEDGVVELDLTPLLHSGPRWLQQVAPILLQHPQGNGNSLQLPNRLPRNKTKTKVLNEHGNKIKFVNASLMLPGELWGQWRGGGAEGEVGGGVRTAIPGQPPCFNFTNT